MSTNVDWFLSLSLWQQWAILPLVGFVVIKVLEWCYERLKPKPAASRKIPVKKGVKKKKKPMTPKAKKSYKGMKWEIDRIMEKQGRKGKGFDNKKPTGINDIL